MMKKITRLCILIGFISSMNVVCADEIYTFSQKIRENGDGTYEDNLLRVETAGNAQDKIDLRELSDEFQQACTQKEDLLEYSELMVRICSYLSFSFKPNEHSESLRQAQKAKAHIDTILSGEEIPIEIIPEYSIIQSTILRSEYLDLGTGLWMFVPGEKADEAWETRRRKVTEKTIRTLRDLERGMDPRWSAEYEPAITEPEITMDDWKVEFINYQSFSPDYIRDPELKREYLDYIKRSNIALVWWSTQKKLYRRFDRWKSGSEQKILPNMYSQEPEALDELKQIMIDNKISPEATKRILSAVAKARGESKSAE